MSISRNPGLKVVVLYFSADMKNGQVVEHNVTGNS